MKKNHGITCIPVTNHRVSHKLLHQSKVFYFHDRLSACALVCLSVSLLAGLHNTTGQVGSSWKTKKICLGPT